MSIYQGLARSARQVLKKYGQAGTITRVTVTGGGPSDTTGGSETSVDTSAKMAVFPISDDRIDGTNVKAGDWQVIVEPVDAHVDDTVTVDGKSLRIVHLGEINPAGTLVAYDMVCRGY